MDKYSNMMDEYEKFIKKMRIFWSICACIGLIPNLFGIYVILSRKQFYKPIFILMATLITSDIASCISMLLFWKIQFHFPFSLNVCKFVNFYKTIPRNFKPILMVITFIVLIIKPKITLRNTTIIIGSILFVCTLAAIPEGMDSRLKEIFHSDNHEYCISDLTTHPIMKFLAFFIKLLVPLFTLIIFLIAYIYEKVNNVIIVRKTRESILLISMLIIYVVFAAPFWIMYYFYNFFISYDNFLTHIIILNSLHSLSLITFFYKPYLLFFTIPSFKNAVLKIFGFPSASNDQIEDDQTEIINTEEGISDNHQDFSYNNLNSDQ